MIHQAAKFIVENRSEGDLLMDVPQQYSWDELKQLAANRDYWRLARVKALTEGLEVHVDMRGNSPSRHTRKTSKQSTTAINHTSTAPQTISVAARAAKRYRARDAHAAFFRPLASNHSKRRCPAKSSNPKRRALTDKERQAAAREHWGLNYGMPEILGHKAEQVTHPNITMASINFQSLLNYHDNATMHHDNLNKFSDILNTSTLSNH